MRCEDGKCKGYGKELVKTKIGFVCPTQIGYVETFM